MLIRFFKTSFFIQYLVLMLFAVGLWLPGMIKLQDVQGVTSMTTPIYNLAHNILVSLQPYDPILAFIIIVICGFTFNNILVYHDLVPRNNLLPAFLFILLFSSDPGILNFYPLILSLPFFTWFLHTIYRINDEPENNIVVFNASIILSVITMIYFPAIALFLLLWMLLPLYGNFSGRNVIITLIGFFLPYLYLAFYYFWIDALPQAGKAYLDFFAGLFRFKFDRDWIQLGIWAFLVILVLVPAFYKITSSLSSYNINFRKKMAATNWFLFISLPVIFMQGNIKFNMLLMIPASIIISHYFNLFKKSVWNEIVLLVFLAIIALHNYLNL